VLAVVDRWVEFCVAGRGLEAVAELQAMFDGLGGGPVPGGQQEEIPPAALTAR
jgi:hypothetical protein